MCASTSLIPQVHLGRYEEAIKAARKGLKIKAVMAGANRADRTVRVALQKTLLEAQRGIQLQVCRRITLNTA